MNNHLRLLYCLLLSWGAVTLAAAQPLRVGDPLPGFTIKDQHEQEVAVEPGSSVRHLVVSFTMGTGKGANSYFENKGAGWLEEHEAAFVANIYGMPGIGRMFALPKMRKYPHRILLGDDEHLLTRYPEQKGKLTVFDLAADGRITAIRFLDPDRELDQLFAD